MLTGIYALWDGCHGFNLNPEVRVGEPRTENQSAGWQGIVVGEKLAPGRPVGRKILSVCHEGCHLQDMAQVTANRFQSRLDVTKYLLRMG
jgi:hypothetical protein